MSKPRLLWLNSTFKTGKYEGKTVKECNDKGYIEWMIENTGWKFMDDVYEHYGIERKEYL